MPRTAAGSLTKLLDQSSRPVYGVDAERRIVYCNKALAVWMVLEPGRIVGRKVEYHSESTGNRDTNTDGDAPLSDLCPPPRAFDGKTCDGTISCMAEDGRLIHRQAEFLPLSLTAAESADHRRTATKSAVLVLLADSDLTPQDLASRMSQSPSEPAADELHRTIRQFRRGRVAAYTIESLLGSSTAMRKVRAQVSAAAASGANVLIYGPPGSGRGHVARAVHYRAGGENAPKLVPLDCRVLNDDQLRRAVDGLRGATAHGRQRPTLLLENLEHLALPYQEQLLSILQQNAIPVRVIATLCNIHAQRTEADPATTPLKTSASDRETGDGTRSGPATMDAALHDAISTIAIHIPRLVERMEDLPILAQSFLESSNRGSEKQVGSIRSEALDLLALHSWPRELDELREVMAAAHRACQSHEVAPSDLPPVIHHATQAAARTIRQPERIVLDELLATMEKEVIVRALSRAGGNKSAAAELLGLTRPRLYRRMIQLGLISEPPGGEPGPEFVERDSADQTP